jgi:hypothetical protein
MESASKKSRGHQTPPALQRTAGERSTKEAYNESVFHKSEADTIRRAEYRLRRQAAQLGFQIIPADNS